MNDSRKPARASKDHDLAVFSRNYRQHLEAAAECREQVTTFRSQALWSRAAAALAAHGPRAIYFCVADGGPQVEYVAEIVEMDVTPERASERTERLLAATAPTAKAEEPLWNGKAKTLYAVRNCRRLKAPFAFTELILLDAKRPLDPNYGRGYALVRERSLPS